MQVVFWGRTDDSEADNGMLSNVFLDPTVQCSHRRQCARGFFFLSTQVIPPVENLLIYIH